MAPSRIIVRNVRGTTGRVCACGSWLNHWYSETGSRRDTCAVLGCGDYAEVGAHVFAINLNRGRNFQHWIVPMCHPCNMSRDDLPIDSRVDLISANTQLMDCYMPYAY